MAGISTILESEFEGGKNPYRIHFGVVGLVVRVLQGVVHLLETRVALGVALRLRRQFRQDRVGLLLSFLTK